MELVRQKNTATIIVFPIVNTTGELVSGATGLDSEIDVWDDDTAPDGFVDCTNEATEIGSTGIYYLSLTQSEMDNAYIAIQVLSTSDNARPQVMLIKTYESATYPTVQQIVDGVFGAEIDGYVSAGTFGELLSVLIESGMANVVATYATGDVVDQGITQDMADTNRCIQYWTIKYSPDLNFAAPDKTRYILARYDANMKLVEKKPSVNTTW